MPMLRITEQVFHWVPPCCFASHPSRTASISLIDQSRSVTPAAIAGVNSGDLTNGECVVWSDAWGMLLQVRVCLSCVIPLPHWRGNIGLAQPSPYSNPFAVAMVAKMDAWWSCCDSVAAPVGGPQEGDAFAVVAATQRFLPMATVVQLNVKGGCHASQ
jgi:hypothetical protein